MIELRLSGQLPELNMDFSDRMKDAAELMERAIQLNFTMGGRPPARGWPVYGQTPWEPLKPPRSGTPLVATGAFYRSINNRSDKTWAEVGVGGNFNDIRIPAIHQYGGMAGRNRTARIPSRPFMVLTDHDMDGLAGIMMRQFIITTNIQGGTT